MLCPIIRCRLARPMILMEHLSQGNLNGVHAASPFALEETATILLASIYPLSPFKFYHVLLCVLRGSLAQIVTIEVDESTVHLRQIRGSISV
jgi:hypothetical protein